MVGVYASTMVLGIILVTVRLYYLCSHAQKPLVGRLGRDNRNGITRLFSSYRFGATLTASNQLLTIASFAFIVICSDPGGGHHMFDLELSLVRRFLKYELMARTTISLAMMCTRISIALFMLRLAATQIWFKRGLYCLIGLLLFSHITLMIVTLASCEPVSKYWNPLGPGRCWSLEAWLAIGCINCGIVIMRLDMAMTD